MSERSIRPQAGTELALAGRVVELVRHAAGPGAQAEVLVSHAAEALTRFANSAIHQNVADATTTVRLRLHLDGRTASGSTTRTDADGLQSLIERTIAAARLSPPDASWPGLTPPTPLQPYEELDEATARATPEDRAARVRDFVAAAGGLETAGYCRTNYASAAFANTAGQSVEGRFAEAAMDGIGRLDGADGVARLASARLADIDGAVLGARAAAKARASGQPIELPPGRYEVVLEPDAVADILGNMAAFGFNGKAFAQRQSFAELGAQQFDSSVTLLDEPIGGPGMPAPGLPFDTEGTPRASLTLVSAGTTVGITHDRASAAEVGAVSTGHGSPASRGWGPYATHLRLAAALAMPAGSAGASTSGVGASASDAGALATGAGAPTSDAGASATGGAAPASGPAAPASSATVGPMAESSRALVATMARGLLITDFWYTRVLDQKSLVVTGLTRNGVWLVEDGEVVAAVGNMRFTQSYPQALGPGAIRGIGTESIMLPDRWSGVRYTAPALHLTSWNLTGNASG